MSNCCHTKEPQQPQEDKQKVTPGCCPSEQGADSGRSHPDYLLWGSGLIVLTGYILYWLLDGHPDLPRWLVTMTSGIYELINTMWWGLLMAVIFVGLLERVPRELVMSALGQGGTAKGIVRATLAGVLLDLCSHGILMVGTKLYERGASLGQLMAFLIASPWNSLSLTIRTTHHWRLSTSRISMDVSLYFTIDGYWYRFRDYFRQNCGQRCFAR